MAPDPGWCFGSYAWRGRRGRCDQSLVPLPPKALAVLWTLANQAGQVVTKAALLERGVARDGGE